MASFLLSSQILPTMGRGTTFVVKAEHFELSAATAVDYLARHGMRAANAVELGGGVSNNVVRVDTSRGALVLKQSLGKLRVADEWLSQRERIFTEADAMRSVAPLLPAGAVPVILFEDRDAYLIAMTAAPQDAVTWKQKLMDGIADDSDALGAAEILGRLASGSWRSAEMAARFGDRTVFDQLRIDPYYRTTAARHPDLREHFDALIAATAARRFTLVHGDFSPKNLLLAAGGMTIIDFEVAHYGDPSFDAAFLLNHLLIKSVVRRPQAAACARVFWRKLRAFLPAEADWFEAATVAHLGCLLLARVDGKSPVEYVQDGATKNRLRGLARELITRPPRTIEEIFA